MEAQEIIKEIIRFYASLNTRVKARNKKACAQLYAQVTHRVIAIACHNTNYRTILRHVFVSYNLARMIRVTSVGA
jgi:hypothetical protein